MLTCLACGAENRAGGRFCVNCGSPLAAACPSCGSAVEPDTRFCAQCGAAIGDQASAQAAPGSSTSPGALSAATAERRLVSVLFVDLVGFTGLSDGKDPEETREFLSRYFELAREIVERYGGSLEKFIGDAVMAVWGAPSAREDDAERAVRAALDIVEAVRSWAGDVQARAGVLTGEAAVTLGARGQGMVAGDLVNTASRLQSAAEPGAVLVGEATMRAAAAAIAFEAVGEQQVRGKALPVPAHRALRVVAERGGRNRSDALEAPFVGRQDEMRLIKDLFHATGREQRSRLVSLIGPAGIGKSRLAWEFLKYIDGVLEDVWWHQGRSPAYGEGITFWALGEMVRRRAGLAETDDEATTRRGITEMVAEFIPEDEERPWIESALLTLLGVGIAGPAASEQLFSAWRTFFERVSARGVTVLVFEDLNWADEGLLDFIDHLLSWSRNHPIYVIALARPELLERHPEWAARRGSTLMTLDPLTPAAMRELLDGLAPGLPAAAAQAIIGRADGIPLYAVETVRTLVADGRLIQEGDVYRPVGDLGTLAIPDSLTALIAARLDALPPQDRGLIQDAAVLGRSFTPDALAAVSGMDAGALGDRLRQLVRREILALEADPQSPERGQYAFVQALIREVAYNTLARADRKTRHVAAARFFESLGTDELAVALAAHYLSAYENSPPGAEADALSAQARIALRAAGDRAARLGSHDQAGRLFEQALSVTPDAADRAGLLEQMAQSALRAGHYESAEAAMSAALELLRKPGDLAEVARGTAALADILLTTQQSERGMSLLEAAAPELAPLGDHPARVELLAQLARATMMRQEHAAAVQVADEALAAGERAQLLPVVADLLITKGTSMITLGRSYEGLALIDAGRDLAMRLGLAQTAMRGATNAGIYYDSADPRKALEMYRIGEELGTRLGMRPLVLGMRAARFETALRCGEIGEAVAQLDAALAEELEPFDRHLIALVAIKVRAVLGLPVDDLLTMLDGLTGEIDDLQVRGAAEDARGLVALARGNLREAHDHWHETARLADSWPFVLAQAARAALWDGWADGARSALAALDEMGAHGPALDASRVTIAAGIAALDGRAADAANGYREALDQWQTLGLPFDAALTVIDMASTLGPENRDTIAAVPAAQQELEAMGAQPFLDRLAQVLTAPTAGSGSTLPSGDTVARQA